MKRVIISALIVSGLTTTVTLLVQPADAQSSRRKEVRCPVIADRETGEFSASRAKYRCYDDNRSARGEGYSRHSFDDDFRCAPTPAPTPTGGGPSGDINLSGPGESESVVFEAPNGGSITYQFTGGGEFEIKVFNASSGRRVEEILETTEAASGSASFAAQSFPIYVKVEGPGSWAVAIDIN